MAEREPTVIERMCAAHWRRGRQGVRTDWWLMTPEGRAEDVADMLAAVRELMRLTDNLSPDVTVRACFRDVLRTVINERATADDR